MDKYFYSNTDIDSKFYRLPKGIMEGKYKGMSSNAKLLYAVMLDRNALSVKNNWKDNKQRVYIYFSIENIMDCLGCSKTTAIKVLKELEEKELVEKKRQGLGKSTIIYVKKMDMDEEGSKEIPASKKSIAKKRVFFYPSESKKCTSGSQKDLLPEGKKVNSNKTYKSKTYVYNKQSSIELPADRKMEIYTDIIKKKLDYNLLYEDFGEEVEPYLNIILDVMMSDKKKIAGINTQLIKNRFMKLNAEHMKYAIWSMRKNKTEIKNMYAYMVTVLYQAPVTMQNYFTALYNYNKSGAAEVVYT